MLLQGPWRSPPQSSCCTCGLGWVEVDGLQLLRQCAKAVKGGVWVVARALSAQHMSAARCRCGFGWVEVAEAVPLVAVRKDSQGGGWAS